MYLMRQLIPGAASFQALSHRHCINVGPAPFLSLYFIHICQPEDKNCHFPPIRGLDTSDLMGAACWPDGYDYVQFSTYLQISQLSSHGVYCIFIENDVKTHTLIQP